MILHRDLVKLPKGRIYGLLTYFRLYVADFAVRIETLRRVQSTIHSEWTPQHTELVKKVVTKILEDLLIISCSPDNPVIV